jgi:predicted MPP superfamily phosphohydrolase
MGAFRIISTSFILVLFMYVCHQLVRFTDMDWWSKLALVLGLAFLFILVIGTFLFFWKEKKLDHHWWRDLLLDTSLTVMAYINFLVTFVILRDIYAFFEYLVLPIPIVKLYSTEATGILMLVPVVLLLMGNVVVRIGPRRLKIPVRYPDLPAELEGFRIMHVTDLHISQSLPASFVKKLVAQIQKIGPDVVVFTGDIMDSFVEKHAEEVDYLKALKAKHGVYLVPGNHEYYWDGPKSIQAFRDAGMNVLINQVANIPVGGVTLQVAGIPDPAALHFQQEGPDFPRVQSQLKDNSFKVMLSHQPSLVHKIKELGFNLQLSGHTHGGQFFPWNFLIIFFERYSKGLYEMGNMRLYVNQGTGYWGPRLRLGTYCELAEIVLRKG